MVDLDETALLKLAREMAINVRNYKKVFEDFGISEEDYYEISKIEFFKRAKEQFSIEWNSIVRTKDRTKLLAAVTTEQMLLIVGKQAMKDTEPLSSRVDFLKTAAKIGGLGEPKKESGDAAERFIITINIGDESKTYSKAIESDPDDGLKPKPKPFALKQISGDSHGKEKVDPGSGQPEAQGLLHSND